MHGSPCCTAGSHHEGIGKGEAGLAKGHEDAVHVGVVSHEALVAAGHQVYGAGGLRLGREYVHAGEGVLLEGRGDVDAVITRHERLPGIFEMLEVQEVVRMPAVIGGGYEARTQRAGDGMSDEGEFHSERRIKLSWI